MQSFATGVFPGLGSVRLRNNGADSQFEQDWDSARCLALKGPT